MIYNLTQHAPTPEQVAAGVVDLPEEVLLEVRELSTFLSLPDAVELRTCAARIATIAASIAAPGTRCMIGGAPFFMEPLAQALRYQALQPVYAFSVRESVDQPQPDGSVRKVAVFRHGGFIE